MRNNSTSKASKPDWERLDAMMDEDIDFSDCPEITAEQFPQGIVRRGLKPKANKEQVTLRVDHDVLEWFRKWGKGYQTKINALFRAYMEANEAHLIRALKIYSQISLDFGIDNQFIYTK